MTRRSWTRRTYRQIDELPAYDDGELARIRDADAQTAKEIDRLGSTEMLNGAAVLVTHVGNRSLWEQRSQRTAQAMILRVRPVPGASPGEIVRMLEQEREARVRHPFGKIVRLSVIALTVAFWTFWALDSDAAESTYCDRAALARAEAEAVRAEAQYYRSPTPQAIAMVEAALDWKRAAEALCAGRETVVDPFEDEPPVLVDTELSPEAAAWMAVCGEQTPEECGGIETPAEKW